MTPDKATALREAAERATPGPWDVVTNVAIRSYEAGHWAVATADPCRKRLANAAYIALADPPTILALLAERERLRGALTQAVAGMAQAGVGLIETGLMPNTGKTLIERAEAARQALEATDDQ